MATLNLITSAEAKAYVGEGSDTRDTTIATIVTGVSLAIKRYVKRPLIIETFTDEYHDGDGTNQFYTFNSPVDLSGTMTLAHDNDDDGTFTSVVSGDYHAYASGLIQLDDDATNFTVFTRGPRNIKITYDAGYFADTVNVDQDVKLAALALFRHFYKGEVINLGGRFGEIELAKATKWPDEVYRILGTYRKRYR